MELLIQQCCNGKACKLWLTRLFALLLMVSISHGVLAKGIYQSTDELAQEVWPASAYASKVHWLTKADKIIAKTIFERAYPGLRIRYKQYDQQTLWTLEEIGKELPITVGIVVGDEGVEQIRILAYRESRGGEVKYPFFIGQFIAAKLTQSFGISNHIDNISGATLSVAAVKRTVAWALYLHQQVAEAAIEPS